MALATNTTAGSIVLKGDLAGTSTSPSLRPTGVIGGNYAPCNFVVDAKGRMIYAVKSVWLGEVEPLTYLADYSTRGFLTVDTSITNSSGVIALKAASTTVLGTIKIGVGLDITGDVVRNGFATSTTLGVVTIGDGFSISGYTTDLIPATTSTIGGVIVPVDANGGLTLSSGTVSITTTSTIFGIAKPGTGLSVQGAGELYRTASIPLATNSTTGAIQSNNIQHITCENGLLDIGPNVVLKSGDNVYTARQGMNIATYGQTITPNLTTSNIHKGVAGAGLTPIVQNPLNKVEGDTFTVVTVSGIAGVATNGYQRVFVDIPASGSPTGLSGASNAAGYQVVNVSGTKGGASATGLDAANSTTSGYQDVVLMSNMSPASATGCDLTPAPVNQSYQDVLVGGNKTLSSSTGLAANQWYTFSVSNGVGGNTSVCPVPGIYAQNYYDLITYICGFTGWEFSDARIVAGGTNPLYITQMYNGNMRLGGAEGRAVFLTDGGTYYDNHGNVTVPSNPLFAALTGYTGLGPTPVQTVPAQYSIQIAVDGISRSIGAYGYQMATYGQMLSVINTQMSAYAVATLENGFIRIKSKSTGTSSSVSIMGESGGTLNLFTDLNGYSSYSTAQAGLTGVDYTATVTINGTGYPITLSAANAQTYTALLAEINAGLGSSATAAIVSGNLRITSSTTGTSSTVLITDTGPRPLFSSLTDYQQLNTPIVGTVPTTYTGTAVIDGVSRPISVAGTAAQTFTQLATELTTDIGTWATVALTTNNYLTITSKTTGVSSTVSLSGNIFTSLLGYKYIDTAQAGGTKYQTAFGTDYKFSNATPIGKQTQTFVCTIVNSQAHCTYL